MKKNSPRGKSGKCRPRKEVLLVEIGNDWIKLVQAELRRGKVTLSKVHLEEIDQNAGISESITRALKAGKFNANAALVCMPRQAVNIRLLELPSTDSVELADMVDLQIGRQTPYSREEILADYKELGHTRQGTYTRVMLAIVQRSIVRERFYELESAGVEIERMGVSGEGVLSWFLQRLKGKKSDEASILLDIDSFYTHLLVVHNGKVIFTKSILVGAKQFQEDKSGSTGRLAQEVKSAIQSCHAEMRTLEFSDVTLSGAGVYIEDLAEDLEKALSLKCEIADCLADVKLGKGASDLGDSRYSSVSLTGLVGVALCPESLEFDLIPDVVKDRKRLMSVALSANRFAALVMVAMFSCALYAMLAYAFRVDHLTRVQKIVKETNAEATKIKRETDVIREANSRQDTRFAVINLLPTLYKSVSENMYFTAMDIDQQKKKMSLAGTASNFQDIRKFIENMDKTPLFTDVAEEGSTTRDNTTGRYKFKIVAKFEEDK